MAQSNIDLKLLVENGVQFGHQTWRWHPKMAPFIWGEKNGVHLIDVSKTARQIQKASRFLESIAAQNQQILWVGTKAPARQVIEKAAHDLGQPYVTNRWIGGTLTNYSQVKKSVTKLLHYEDVISKTGDTIYTKKELSSFQKLVDRLQENVGGIRELVWPVGAVVVVDARKEYVAVKEAQAMGIPVVALTDTNTDPSGIDYVIPTNDDVGRAIKAVIDPLVAAVSDGMHEAAKQQEDAEKAKAQEELAQKDAAEASDEETSSKASTTSKQTTADDKEKTTKKSASQASKTTKASTTAKKTSTQSKSQKEASSSGDAEEVKAEKKSSQKATSQASKTTKTSSAKSSTAKKTVSSESKSQKKAAVSEKKEETSKEEASEETEK